MSTPAQTIFMPFVRTQGMPPGLRPFTLYPGTFRQEQVNSANAWDHQELDALGIYAWADYGGTQFYYAPVHIQAPAAVLKSCEDMYISPFSMTSLATVLEKRLHMLIKVYDDWVRAAIKINDFDACSLLPEIGIEIPPFGAQVPMLGMYVTPAGNFQQYSGIGIYPGEGCGSQYPFWTDIIPLRFPNFQRPDDEHNLAYDPTSSPQDDAQHSATATPYETSEDGRLLALRYTIAKQFKR